MRFAKQNPLQGSYPRGGECFCQVKKNSSFIIFLVPGCSVVWLARLLWEQEAVSSNLTIPTIFFRILFLSFNFLSGIILWIMTHMESRVGEMD